MEERTITMGNPSSKSATSPQTRPRNEPSDAGPRAAAGRAPKLPPRAPLPRPIALVLFWKRTLPFIAWARRRVGNTFTVWSPPWGNVVLLTDPDDIKELFGADPQLVHPGEGYATVFTALMGPRSIFVLDEDEHLRTRKLMLPPFHGDRVKAYGELIARIAAEEVDSWEVGRSMRLIEATQRITLGVMLDAVFGISDPERRRLLQARLPQTIGPGTLIQIAWMYPWLERVGPWRRHRRLVDGTYDLIRAEIAERRADPNREQRTDVLSMLIDARFDDGRAMTDDDLLSQLMALLLAGHETTASALAYGFERLLRHPPVLEHLLAELRDGPGEYLEAVIKETLRVRPVVPNVIRRLTADADVAGFRLPAGTYMMPSIGGVNTSEALYPDAQAFRPERFLGDSPPPQSNWIPFGRGRRHCLGASLATYEMKVVLDTVLSRVEMAATSARSEEAQMKHVTTAPRHGARVRVVRRLVPAGAPHGEDARPAGLARAG
ncbi:MAG TPA: cytochrome P450 [Thermoleophilaceae bacterium]|jgi:cytochrome P450